MKNYFISFVLFVFFLLYLVNLNQSLWLDEATTAKVANMPIIKILSEFTPKDFHPPLYYILLNFWTKIAGSSEVALRLPSVLFTLLAGFFVYKSMGILKNTNAALWALVFFLANPLVVYFAQEARMYAMVTTLVAGYFYFFIHVEHKSPNTVIPSERSDEGSRAISSRWQMDIIICNLLATASLLTFYGSIFFFVTVFLYIAWRRKWRYLWALVPGVICAILLVLPILLQQLANAKVQLALVTNWNQVLGNVNPKNAALIPIKFTSGRISFEPKALYFGIAGIWLAATSIFALLGIFKNPKPAIFLVGPLVLGLVVSFVTPMLQYFRFLYTIPFLAMLLSLGTSGLPPGTKLRNSILATLQPLLLVGFLLWSAAYLLIPQFHREDWKALSQKIPTSEIYMIPTSADPVLYYRPDMIVRDLKNLSPEKITKPITVIPYTADIHGINFRKTLEDAGFSKTSGLVVRGLDLEVWSPPAVPLSP